MLFVNFKTYEMGSGADALNLVGILERVAKERQAKIIACLQASDIKEAASFVGLEIWAQHIDAVEFGAHTGAILAEAVLEDGATGTLLNHSEKRFENYGELDMANKRAKKAGLRTLIFAKDLKELKVVVGMQPDFASYEPPELVGSKDMSVAKAKATEIKEAALITNEAGIPLIVGAGIKAREDVVASLSLGASGVLVASDIVASNDPLANLTNIVEGF